MASLISAVSRAALVTVMAVLQLSSSASSAPIGLPGCATSCGNVSVPYPFGMGPARCSWPGFNLTCEICHDGTHRLHLIRGDVNGCIHIDAIYLRNATLRAFRMGNMSLNYTASDIAVPAGPAYSLSAGNEFIFFGCDMEAALLGVRDHGHGHGGGNTTATESIIARCVTNCSEFRSLSSRYCNGQGCCQAAVAADSVPTRLVATRIQGLVNNTATSTFAYVAEEGWYDPFLKHEKAMTDMQLGSPLLLRWGVKRGLPAATGGERCPGDVGRRLCKSEASDCRRESSGGYTCHCKSGYDGNPYIIRGCQDINECDLPEVQSTCFGECRNLAGSYECRCPRGSHGNHSVPNGCVRSTTGISIGIGVGSGAGLILFIAIANFMVRKFKNRREKMFKQKFFKQNRGQLLQQLVSQQADIAERMIITVDELAKATNNFDKDRELGGGGHGTVYKGILSDLQVVAIKKSKITVQKEIDEFINEVAILSQVNHKNVVKLFGCCLETEVPLLVYEFISNGTLYHHLHVEGPISLSWSNRLRIVTQIANALAYLHSSVSVPIIHRDIKSTNILLDETLSAKVSDFGASRYIAVDKTGLTTKVQGTIGYLDPTYFYTGRLSEKSDVYSFGVMLVELLTRKKPFLYLSSNGDGLVAHFVNLLNKDNLVDILDPQVINDGGKEVHEVAILAASCIKLEGDDRPTMRQVEHTLEGLQSSKNYNKNDIMVDKIEESGIILVGGQPTIEDQGIREFSICYSSEQDMLMSASYPR